MDHKLQVPWDTSWGHKCPQCLPALTLKGVHSQKTALLQEASTPPSPGRGTRGEPGGRHRNTPQGLLPCSHLRSPGLGEPHSNPHIKAGLGEEGSSKGDERSKGLSGESLELAVVTRPSPGAFCRVTEGPRPGQGPQGHSPPSCSPGKAERDILAPCHHVRTEMFPPVGRALQTSTSDGLSRPGAQPRPQGHLQHEACRETVQG